MPAESQKITIHPSYSVHKRDGDGPDAPILETMHLFHPEIPTHLIPDTVRNHFQQPDLTDDECHQHHADSVEFAKTIGFEHSPPFTGTPEEVQAKFGAQPNTVSDKGTEVQ